ncbi:MAG: hypothetical protein MR589_05770 [Lachnobacterium sp.]|nr:hypothetical protein [Lachnobacterium sp.]
MNRLMKQCAAFVLAFALAFTSVNMTGLSVETTYAATTQTITKATTVVCKKNAAVKVPAGYRNCKFSSSNAKVATVNAKGKLKALRLGVTTITVKSGVKKKNYTITVVPAKKSDVRLNQELIFSGQKFQLKLVSDKYDTSQVKLKFTNNFKEIDKKGNCNFVGFDYYTEYGALGYSYGQFYKESMIYVCEPEAVCHTLIDLEPGTDTSDIDAGVPTSIPAGNKYDVYSFDLQQYKAMGVKPYLDGKPLAKKVTLTPGKHVISFVTVNKTYDKEFYVSYSVKEALLKKDATGYSEEGKEVFDAAFAAVNQVIRDGMSEDEKVKAIHDYLIYSANYVNDGDYSTAEGWAYGATGVLIHKEGVCQSYAIAFYMMAVSAGLDCKYVTGTAHGVGHAWNQVKVGGKWYYIDCTWDDPIMNGHSGGGERYDYYLSESLWSDHTATESKDLADSSKINWENFYLTGEGYRR